ncbi:MAG: hypothetical protein NTY90_00240 [Candidatus Micrarchaeota archaeon]|nr:hypothetical protein [Candidatus Micrarchaeota archaeon]
MALGDFYRALEDRYYSLCEWLDAHGLPAVKWFVEPLESRGMPSFPIAVLIVLLIIGGLGYAIFAAQPASAAFRLKVLSGEELVGDAAVEVYDEGIFVASATTDEKGTAEFSGLPRKKLEFRIIRGGKTVSKEIDLGRSVAGTIQLAQPTPAVEAFAANVLVVNANSSAPVKDARVLYSYADISASVNTDAKGRARLPVTQGTEVAVRVTHPNYKQNSLTFIASRETQTVRLESKAAGGPIVFAPAPTGMVVVDVSGTEGEAVDGEARLYDAFTFAKIAAASVNSGTALFENVSIAELVYVVVEAPGYLSYDGSLEPVSVEETTEMMVVLEAATEENSGQTLVKTVDENGALVPAKVFLLSAATNAVLSEKDSEGELPLEVASGVPYYAVASAEGRVAARSEAFEARQAVSMTVPLATDANSANLTVVAVTRDGSAVPFASVTVSMLDESFITPQAETDAQGTAVFSNLPLGQTYLVKAVYSDESLGTLKVALSVVLDASKSVSMVLEAPDGFLKIGSIDTTTNKPVSANYTSYYVTPDEAEVPYSTCYGAACRLSLRSSAENKVAARAPNYLDYWLAETVEPEEEKNQTVYLIPSVLVKGVAIEFMNVTDFYGKPAANLLPGKTYAAKFLVASEPGMESTGFYLRIGSKATAEEDLAAIVEGGYPSADKVAKSTTFNPGAQCDDLNNNQPVDGSLKWIDLSWRSSGTRVLEIKLKVSEKAKTGDSITLAYRAYAVKGGKWTRGPADAELGMESNSTAKAGCYALAYEKAIQVIAPVAAGVPVPPAAEFTQTASIWYDPEERKVKANVEDITLQIDTIFPFDAMPLNYSPSEILVEQANSTATPSTAKCYLLESRGDAVSLVFKPKEANPECPIGVKGNEIEGDESASISFHSTKDPGVKITFPITLKANSLPSVFVKPDELSEGDKSAKLVYLVNQKQTQRLVEASTENESKKYPLDPGVKAIAWRGPGTISFSEDGQGIWELDYQQVKSYFPGMHDLGLVMRKACTDYLCCANGWCSKDAARAAFDLFKNQSQALAASTAFRRGNGEPFKYFFPEKQFTLSMVAQLREGTDVASLGAENEISFAADSAGKCKAGNPGVYEIKAVTSGGGNWTYAASVVPLFKMNYVTDACDKSQYYYAHAESAGDYVPLCDFLFGDSNCVRPVDHMVLAAESEATDPHITPIPVPSWFLGLLPAISSCKAADTLYSTALATGFAKGKLVGGSCAGTSVAPVIIEAVTAYQKCMVNTPITVCHADATTKISTAVSSCTPTTPPTTCDACRTAWTGLQTQLKSELAAGEACDKISVKAGWDPESWDIPGVILPRGAWLTCYAYAEGCHLRCSKRSAYALVIPVNNQKWYIIHIGLTKNCLPNPLGISVILAAFDAVAGDWLHKNLGAFGQWAPLIGTTAMGLMDAVSDPFFPGGPKADGEGVPPKGTEDEASDASSKSLDKKLSELAKSLIPQVASTAVQGSKPSTAGQNYNSVGNKPSTPPTSAGS